MCGVNDSRFVRKEMLHNMIEIEVDYGIIEIISLLETKEVRKTKGKRLEGKANPKHLS